MPNRQTMTISLPPEMVAEVDKVRKAEHRTRSELVREALRRYFNPELAARIARLPVYVPSKGELRAIREGREAIRRGEFVTLDQLRAHVGGESKQARRKGARARATA